MCLFNSCVNKTTTNIYDYINENSKLIFKKNPKDKIRISYLVSDL